MFKRLAGAVPAAILATLAIVFSMQALVAHGKPAITGPRTPGTLGLAPPMDDSELRVDERFFEPEIPKPMPVPEYRPEVSTDPTAVRIRTTMPAPPDGDSVVIAPASSDSPLAATMRAFPVYPTELAGRGIEGWVEVIFDVMPSGNVVNVAVVEASHRGFARSAIRAAERSRFQPAMLDGIPQGSTGVRYRYVFRLEN